MLSASELARVNEENDRRTAATIALPLITVRLDSEPACISQRRTAGAAEERAERDKARARDIAAAADDDEKQHDVVLRYRREETKRNAELALDASCAGRIASALPCESEATSRTRMRCPACNTEGALVADLTKQPPSLLGVHTACIRACAGDQIAAGLVSMVRTYEAGLVKFYDDCAAHEAAARRSAMTAETSILKLKALGKQAWVIDELIPDESLTLLVGAAGSGKTFAALHTSICVAADVPWLGRRVRTGPALLVLLEGSDQDFGRRIAALARGLGTSLEGVAEQLHLYPKRTLKTGEPASLAELADYIREFGYRLIVIDNLTEIRDETGSENDVTTMSAALRPLAQLAHEARIAIVVLHHANAHGDARGSTAILQHVDHVLELTRATDSNDATLTLTRGKARSGGGLTHLTMRLVDRRSDDAIVPEEVRARSKQEERKVDPRRQKLLDALPANASEIYAAVGGQRAAAVRLRNELQAEGIIEEREKLWYLSGCRTE